MTADEFLTSMSESADDQDGMQHRHALDPATSLVDYAAATASTPESVGRTLRALAERRFTGEAVLDLASAPGAVVRVHLDAGQPYVAERVDDESLAQRLVAHGVIESEQLQRGMVPVGDVEHLGRLFQRERTINRDAVIAVVEAMTDALLTEVATDRASVTITPYRHHRSGVHRWFVGPQRVPSPFEKQAEEPSNTPTDDVSVSTGSASPAAVQEPSPLAAPTPADLAGDVLRVEWAEPIPPFGPPVAAPFGPPVAAPYDSPVAAPFDPPAGHSAAALADLDDVGDSHGHVNEIDITGEIERFDADAADWEAVAAGSPFAAPPVGHVAADDLVEPEPPAPLAGLPAPSLGQDLPTPLPGPSVPAVAPATDASAAEPSNDISFDGEFTMVWPDGSEVDFDEPTNDSTRSHGETTPAPAEPHDLDGALPSDAEAETPTFDAPDSDALDDPVVEPTSASEVAIDSTEPEEMPDDVAEAVRRALAAIERAAVDPAVPARLGGAAVDLPNLTLEPIDPAGAEQKSAHTPSEPTVEPTDEAAVARAEPPVQVTPIEAAPTNVFAPPSAAMSAEAPHERAAAARADDAPAPGQASVVFVDGDDDAELTTTARTSALKRLIGSMRKGR